MSLDNDISVLASTELFADLNSDQLRLLAFGTERTRFNAGRTIYREGDKADCAYVVAQGSVSLHREGREGLLPAENAEVGTMIGEMALLTATQRDRTAIAASDLELLRINRSLFQRMLSEYPELAMDLHERMSERLRRLLADIAAIDGRFAKLRDF